jgi:hypothetical protein
MTTLPFADEIRVARQQSEEAAAATALLQQVQATLQSLEIIRRQHGENDAIQPEIPGSQLINDVIARWPTLGALQELGAANSASYSQQLTAAKLQQDTIQAHLAPITAEEHERAHRLSHLQAEQQQAMAAPEWAAIAAELRGVGIERDKLAVSLASARQKVAIVTPTQAALTAYLQQIRQESTSSAGDAQLRDSRVRLLVAEGIKRVRAIAVVSKLQIGLPDLLDTEPSSSRIQESIEELAKLLTAVDGQLQSLQAEVEHQQSAFDDLTAQLLERLG